MKRGVFTNSSLLQNSDLPNAIPGHPLVIIKRQEARKSCSSDKNPFHWWKSSGGSKPLPPSSYSIFHVLKCFLHNSVQIKMEDFNFYIIFCLLILKLCNFNLIFIANTSNKHRQNEKAHNNSI